MEAKTIFHSFYIHGKNGEKLVKSRIENKTRVISLDESAVIRCFFLRVIKLIDCRWSSSEIKRALATLLFPNNGRKAHKRRVLMNLLGPTLERNGNGRPLDGRLFARVINANCYAAKL